MINVDLNTTCALYPVFQKKETTCFSQTFTPTIFSNCAPNLNNFWQAAA